MKQGLLSKISVLGKELPLNTLDELIDKFGGPDKVSEVQAVDSQLETLWPLSLSKHVISDNVMNIFSADDWS